MFAKNHDREPFLLVSLPLPFLFFFFKWASSFLWASSFYSWSSIVVLNRDLHGLLQGLLFIHGLLVCLCSYHCLLVCRYEVGRPKELHKAHHCLLFKWARSPSWSLPLPISFMVFFLFKVRKLMFVSFCGLVCGFFGVVLLLFII
jgi:hypothetical protein